VPYDALKDFVPIALYVKSPFILVVNPALPIHSVPELIKYVKERPGQLSYSSSGVGGAPHLSAEYMKQRFDIDLAHVPYRNSPQSITDVAAGHVAMAFAEAGASLALIRDGKLRALAVTSSTRLPTGRSCRRSARQSARPISRRCRGMCCWRRPGRRRTWSTSSTPR
jgi:tripartite-type tricarboxylate transporter receptor subunit TctC